MDGTNVQEPITSKGSTLNETDKKCPQCGGVIYVCIITVPKAEKKGYSTVLRLTYNSHA